MEFDIKNRFTGRVQFTAKIECDEIAPTSMKIRLAVSWGVKNGANLRDANLCDADLCGANLRGADLCGADLRDADLRDANLCDANLCDANLRGADLCDANLCGANLCDANLCDANLRGADLCDANLCGADLCDANLCDANLLSLGQRSDGYDFLAHIVGGEIWIKAGCRYFSIKDAAKHWKDTRGGTQLGAESLQFLKHARALVKIRGMK